MDVYPLVEELTHKITYYRTKDMESKDVFLVKCVCGFQELSDDPLEIQDLGRKHRDKYILKTRV